MSVAKIKQNVLKVKHEMRRDVRTQFGAICYRIKNEKLQILLVTSRGTGRWIIPKGWPMHKMTPAQAAAQEALEEAGVEGKTGTECLGIYSYVKDYDHADDLPCVVALFPLKVKRILQDYPEKSERRRKWFSQQKAAQMVSEPELREIIKSFVPPKKPKAG